MDPIKRTVELLGGAPKAAIALDLSPALVYFCLQGKRKFPQDKCPVAERLTHFEVRCEELRPDLRWERVPDPDWVHGKPLLDVTAPEEPQQH